MLTLPRRVVIAIGTLALLRISLVTGAEDSMVSAGKFVVTYQADALTIQAQDVPLIDILRAVCRELGATLDVPGAMVDRTTVNLGPGPARQVVNALLKSSGMNYAVTGSAGKPNEFAQIFVLPRSTDTDVSSQAAPARVARVRAMVPEVSAAQPPSQMLELIAKAQAELANLGRPASGQPGEDEGAIAVDPALMAHEVSAMTGFLVRTGNAITANSSGDFPQQ